MQDSESALHWLVDRAAIIDCIVGIANAFDAQDWERVRSFLTDELVTDYSQFRNEPPSRVHADTYVQSRKQALAGVQTLHVSTNHEVRVSGDRAECRSAYRIYRLKPQMPPVENRFDASGTYHHELVRTTAGWLISSITQTVLVREGNPLVHGAFAT